MINPVIINGVFKGVGHRLDLAGVLIGKYKEPIPIEPIDKLSPLEQLRRKQRLLPCSRYQLKILVFLVRMPVAFQFNHQQKLGKLVANRINGYLGSLVVKTIIKGF
jgi:hypothetical protein